MLELIYQSLLPTCSAANVLPPSPLAHSGVATLMGTSTRQMAVTYAPGLRGHRAERAINAHRNFRERVRATATQQ